MIRKNHAILHLLFYDYLHKFCVILGAMHSIASGEPEKYKTGSPNCGAKRLVEDDEEPHDLIKNAR